MAPAGPASRGGGAIVAYYLARTPVATRGGLAFELALAAIGIVLGLAAGLTFRVFRDKSILWSQAGIGYALLWIVVIGARVGFARSRQPFPHRAGMAGHTTSPPARSPTR